MIMRPARLAAAFIAALAAMVWSSGPLSARPNWLATVAVTPSGAHLLGNPGARVQLVEYISYTCPHCAEFHKASEAPLRIGYVQQGRVAVEVRHLVRDPVDLAATLLADCGPPARFVRNHDMFLRTQATWLEKASQASAVQKQRWSNGPTLDRMRAIVRDLGFGTMMEQRGYTPVDIDRCLGDEAATRRIMAQRQGAIDAGVQGTPGFLLNGQLLDNVYDWPGLDAAIRTRL